MSKRTTIEQRIYDLADSLADSLGFELIDVNDSTRENRRVLAIIIDKRGGANFDDCSNLSIAIDPLLDQMDIIKTEYDLEVSSPGIDRPIETDRDLDRNIGNLIEANFFLHREKKLKLEGILTAFDEQNITIILDEPFVKGVKPKTNGQERIIPRGDIKLLRKAIRF